MRGPLGRRWRPPVAQARGDGAADQRRRGDRRDRDDGGADGGAAGVADRRAYGGERPLADHRQAGQPRGRPHRPQQATLRDGEQGPYDDGVELGAGAGDDLVERGLAPHRLVVRADGGHRLEAVGDADDPGAGADRLAGQADRVAGAVVALVVLGDHPLHRAQPGQQRAGDDRAQRRVLAQQVPLAARSACPAC